MSRQLNPRARAGWVVGGWATRESRGWPRCSAPQAANPSTHVHAPNVSLLASRVVYLISCHGRQPNVNICPCAAATVIGQMWVHQASAAHRTDSRSQLVLVHSSLLLLSTCIPLLHSPSSSPLSLLVVLMINPYDRYASDNTPSRSRISFSRKAAPVVSITATSAISTGRENRSPASSIPFPSTPLSISTQTCGDALYIQVPFPGDPVSTPEQTAHMPSTCPHRRQRSNSGLMCIQLRDPRPLATLNCESRANVGYVDFGKSTPVLSITSSGTVSRVDNDRLGKTLAAARQRRLQQLDWKRNPSMVTKKQAKKAAMDAKFLIALHHSITWHIENRSDAKGLSPFCPWDPERSRNSDD